MADTFTKERAKRGQCDSCEAAVINGVYCHETGCPNANAKWDKEREEWIHYYECVECGSDVERGTTCSCHETEGEEFAEL